MGFQQGLSGLDAASKNLDVIGSNVANANTVGYKKSTAEFGDVYARSLVGASDNQIGQGVDVTKVSQSFTQGNVTVTGNPLDIAINGTGFYRMVDASSGQVSYTRNGQFQTDKNGYIISATGQNLTGYGVDATGKINTAVLTNLQIPVNDLAPLATTNTAFTINLDAAATVPTTTPFSATNSATFNHSVSEQVYDGTGTSHMLTNYYVRTATGWDVYSQVDGANPTGGNPVTSLTFNSSGTLTSSPSKVAVAFAGMSIANMDFTGTTQYGGGFNDTTVSQDGYATGRLASYSVGTDGTITGRYSNGRTSTLGQIAMTNFKAPDGLQNIGGNQWVETAESGSPQMGTPGMGSFGLLQSSAVEQSNVDLSAELVNMIVAQRSYQANAQTIKTEDQLLQTLVSMR
ncbi:flagellar hook protein FlgE [Ralstonia syzygii subsp. celebesensis]|uniref:Flagellar hook protein FlgE n=4 Tax=Ralstonia solanacearum species complex TaxID=3116862 RepID=A0AAD0WI36_RALSL|nr:MULTISPECIES: flagellar hook protein FlgE [Ralstonia solanacearum species complex]CCA81636.1 flagellar hook protein FlgE [blood disease bacterium R229]BEU73919.1 flagellar hook protein FlgE [Ralstonia pseudosolanacearum]AMP39450.1 flagellar biosynthesis protein FlgE [Ralstonia solanacearum]AQW30968.1 flagellar hook protein FlgE [blood disease bacterium A2-HR MARDI]AXV78836.1 flagellar hook protein FlgE [Ralstonia solanacearum]